MRAAANPCFHSSQRRECSELSIGGPASEATAGDARERRERRPDEGCDGVGCEGKGGG
jgi:hypothetical protein